MTTDTNSETVLDVTDRPIIAVLVAIVLIIGMICITIIITTPRTTIVQNDHGNTVTWTYR